MRKGKLLRIKAYLGKTLTRYLLLVFLSTQLFAQSMYPFQSPEKEAQFENLLKELRCLVCQNQDLANSDAQLAKDLRRQVYFKVQNGQSDTEIMAYLTDRYGDFILFKPPVKPITWLLWFGPMIFLFLGGLVFVFILRKR